MKQLLLILSITLLTIGSGMSQNRYSRDEVTEIDWITYLKSDMTPVNGIAEEEYDNDGRAEFYYKDGKVGLFKVWYENGQLKREGNLKDREPDGLWRSWNETGQLVEEGNFKDGEYDGLWRHWYENGQFLKEVNYKDGKRNGLVKRWYEDGRIMYETEFINGTGVDKSYYENGQVKWESNYKDTKKISVKEWDEKGNLTKSGNLYSRDEVTLSFVNLGNNTIGGITVLRSDGTPVDGIVYAEYDNGQLKVEGNYKEGEQDGLYKGWYENGQLNYEANYKDGERDGLYRFWYQNGRLQLEENYKDGELISKKQWDKAGNLTLDETY